MPEWWAPTMIITTILWGAFNISLLFMCEAIVKAIKGNNK
jgi:hypothetical protein